MPEFDHMYDEWQPDDPQQPPPHRLNFGVNRIVIDHQHKCDLVLTRVVKFGRTLK